MFQWLIKNSKKLGNEPIGRKLLCLGSVNDNKTYETFIIKI